MNRKGKTIIAALLVAVIPLGVLNAYQAVNPPTPEFQEHGVHVNIQNVFLSNMTLKRNTYYWSLDSSGSVWTNWWNHTAKIFTTTSNGETHYFDENGFGVEPVNYTHVYSY